MTDNDIVKALECCNDLQWCGHCPLQGKEYCKDVLSDNTLDLINRQKAEIEAWKHYYNECLTDLKNAHAEIEKLKKGWKADVILTANVKSEAYKEFAEKVCDEITDAIISNDKVIKERVEKHNVNRLEDNFCCMCDGKISALGGIKYFINNNLLKELVGDENG
jgi:phage-related minor tail protein